MKQPPYFFDAPQEVHPERLWVLAKLANLQEKIVGPVAIVDVGCGTHKTIPSAVGVDTRAVTDYQSSMDKMPFEDGSVDILISRHSFEHALDPVAVLGEWRRVLTPDGRVLVVLPDHAEIPTMDPFYGHGEHLHAYTQESFGNLIEALDVFAVEEIGVVVPEWSFGAVLRGI
jgi:SAM-dependent methyltransferase